MTHNQGADTPMTMDDAISKIVTIGDLYYKAALHRASESGKHDETLAAAFKVESELTAAIQDLTAALSAERSKNAAIRNQALEDRAIVIDDVGGFCPCQADGTFYGMPFYFRARHGAWTLEVAHPGEDPVSNGSFLFVEGDDPNAGFMPQHEAVAVIGKVFAENFWPKYHEHRRSMKDKP